MISDIFFLALNEACRDSHRNESFMIIVLDGREFHHCSNLSIIEILLFDINICLPTLYMSEIDE